MSLILAHLFQLRNWFLHARRRANLARKPQYYWAFPKPGCTSGHLTHLPEHPALQEYDSRREYPGRHAPSS